MLAYKKKKFIKMIYIFQIKSVSDFWTFFLTKITMKSCIETTNLT